MNENDGIVIGWLANRFPATYWEQDEAVLWAEGSDREEAVAALNERMKRASATTQAVAPANPANEQSGVSNEPIQEDRAKTDSRTRRLGMVGKRLAEAELVSHGFTNIRNLYTHRSENVVSDIYAEREGRRYWICVKARNKYAQDGKPNPCYRATQSTRKRMLKDEQDHPGTESLFECNCAPPSAS